VPEAPIALFWPAWSVLRPQAADAKRRRFDELSAASGLHLRNAGACGKAPRAMVRRAHHDSIVIARAPLSQLCHRSCVTVAMSP